MVNTNTSSAAAAVAATGNDLIYSIVKDIIEQRRDIEQDGTGEAREATDNFVSGQTTSWI